HRPYLGLLHRGHRRTVLLPHHRLPRRSAIAAEFTGGGPGGGYRARGRLTGDRQSERKIPMNNLYRDLAPITEEAWEEIELEARRTFKRHIAGRRVVDVSESAGPAAAAGSTGRLLDVKPPSDGVISHLRASKPLVRLRVPFTLSRLEIDNVERGSQDSDWDPVKAAAKKLAFAEDHAIFEGYSDALIDGIRSCSSNPALTLPKDISEFPDVISQALSSLRLAS